jgi:hypothetical protein
LPVVRASPEEALAHEALLIESDQASRGKTLWPRLAPPEAVA